MTFIGLQESYFHNEKWIESTNFIIRDGVNGPNETALSALRLFCILQNWGLLAVIS